MTDITLQLDAVFGGQGATFEDLGAVHQQKLCTTLTKSAESLRNVKRAMNRVLTAQPGVTPEQRAALGGAMGEIDENIATDAQGAAENCK